MIYFPKPNVTVVPSFDVSQVSSRRQMVDLAKCHTFTEPSQRFGFTVEHLAQLPANRLITDTMLQSYIDKVRANSALSVYAGYSPYGLMELGLVQADIAKQALLVRAAVPPIMRRDFTSLLDLPSFDELKSDIAFRGTIGEYLHNKKPALSFVVNNPYRPGQVALLVQK